MSGSKSFSEHTLKNLYDEIALLKRRVENLEAMVAADLDHAPEGMERTEVVKAAGKTAVPDRWSEGAVANFMSKGAAVSLILLAALVLRVITENGVVGLGAGIFLGIGYAALLVMSGFLLYRNKSPFAGIFSTSGILLLVAVVLEAHSVYSAIPAASAYSLMAAAAGGMTVLSLSYGVALPACVGIVAVIVAGLSLDFPEPHFAALGLFLAAVNVMVFNAARLPRCRWIRSVVFVVTAFTLFLWAVKLSASLRSGISPPAERVWFTVFTVAFFVFYTGVSVLGVWRSSKSGGDLFTKVLPSAAGILAYTTYLMVVVASGSGQRGLGITGVAAATALLGIASVRARRNIDPPGGINTFAFPAAFLLALSFRDVSGRSVVALAILSWAALSLAWLSSKWSSEGVRVTSYFLQALVLAASSLLLLRVPSGHQPAAVTLSMAFTGSTAFLHYMLIRRDPPAGRTAYFSQFDKKDLSGVVPLAVAAGAVFLAIRSVFFVLLGGGGQSFQAAETVIVSLGALVLFAAAWMRRNSEFKWLAALITVLGGGKVFLYDLFQVKGLPVLLSFLAFASAASMGSLVLKRWPQRSGK